MGTSSTPGLTLTIARMFLSDSGHAKAGLEGLLREGLPCPTTLLIGTLITLLPRIAPRLMPVFLAGRSDLKAQFADPDYMKESEQLFREKFVENLMMVEDIVTASGDGSLERKGQEYTGFKKFLFGSLEALDINVSDYLGGMDISSLQGLARVARGEDPMDGIYNIIADGIISVGSYVYQTFFNVNII